MTAVLERTEAQAQEQAAEECHVCIGLEADEPAQVRHWVRGGTSWRHPPLYAKVCCEHFELVMGEAALRICRMLGHLQ